MNFYTCQQASGSSLGKPAYLPGMNPQQLAAGSFLSRGANAIFVAECRMEPRQQDIAVRFLLACSHETTVTY
jgi:hypothetical protein